MEQFDYLKFIAAVSLFVFAMFLLEQSLRSLAGRSFKKFLQRQSASAPRMIAASTVATAVMQSSSIVLLIVLSFVGGGLMNLHGALAATLGCNLGTTLSNWIIALVGFDIKLTAITYPLLALALLGSLIARKNSKIAHAAHFFIAFALIFLSLEWFKGTVDQSLAGKIGAMAQMHYLLFVPLGLFITAVVQSSSVTVAMTLAALYNQVIPFESAAGVVIGSELGTTLKFLLGSVKGIPDKKRVAIGNTIINAVTMLLAMPVLKPLAFLIQETIGITDPLVGLVLFQTMINLASIAVFYPFLRPLARYLEKLVSNRDQEDLTRFIGKKRLADPRVALRESEKEIARLLQQTIRVNEQALALSAEKRNGMLGNLRDLATGDATFESAYQRIKLLQGEVLEFISDLPDEDMSAADLEQAERQVRALRHLLRSAKNLKDIRHNVEEFDASANDTLFELFSAIRDNAQELYRRAGHQLTRPSAAGDAALTQMEEENRAHYDSIIRGIVEAARLDKISEIESSNLINVNREVYSSNRGLLKALRGLGQVHAS